MSPRGLERRCRSCHGEDRRAPNADFPRLARQLHEQVIEVREMLEPVDRRLRHLEPDRRAEIEAQLRQAEVPLLEAVRAAHSFGFDGLGERFETAKRRAEELLDELLADGDD